MPMQLRLCVSFSERDDASVFERYRLLKQKQAWFAWLQSSIFVREVVTESELIYQYSEILSCLVVFVRDIVSWYWTVDYAAQCCVITGNNDTR